MRLEGLDQPGEVETAERAEYGHIGAQHPDVLSSSETAAASSTEGPQHLEAVIVEHSVDRPLRVNLIR